MEAASPNLCRKLEGADQETQLIPALFYLICLISIKAAVLWAHWQLSFTIETKGTGQALCVCVCVRRCVHRLQTQSPSWNAATVGGRPRSK